jgi:hypothetical protein
VHLNIVWKAAVSEATQVVLKTATVRGKKLLPIKMRNGKKMKTKKNTLKFTQGTSPFEKDILNFVSGELVACPQYLPMLPEDATYTVTAL